MRTLVLLALVVGCNGGDQEPGPPPPFDPTLAGTLTVDGDAAGRLVVPGDTVDLAVVFQGPMARPAGA
jgi:hypothetical protein